MSHQSIHIALGKPAPLSQQEHCPNYNAKALPPGLKTTANEKARG
jgi:hypothetical protein